jgi:single-strand DNA-binding protein
MGARTMKQDDQIATAADLEAVNEVSLRGRISQDPEEKVLPSGDRLWTFRLVVGRTGDRGGSRQTVDVLDCAVWAGRVQRSVSRWRAGDVVEVGGAVRRRFFRGAGGTASRVEVEVVRGRLIRRAANG